MLSKYFTKEELIDLKKEKNLLLKCERLVTRLFAERKDKEGAPYLGHLKRVSASLENFDEKCAGLLHDSIEDILEVDERTLKYLEIPENIIEMVLIVTKDKNLTYPERIDKIINSNNLGAIRLKYADMKDNMDYNRLKKLDEDTRRKLIKKYKTQLPKLEKVLKKKEVIK